MSHMKCEFCKIALPVILVILASFYIAYQFVPPSASKELRIATGSKKGAYYQYALQYQDRLKQEGLDLEILNTAGSVEALQLLVDGEVDLAFVQGGVTENQNNKAELSSIASLFYEPLWVFHRKELNTLKYLHELRGKRLSIGKKGSGTRALVIQLLRDNGIDSVNTQLLGLSHAETEIKLQSGEIDAAFFVMSPKSKTIPSLASHPDISIMDFSKRARAYTSHYPFLTSLVIGEGMINLKDNIPNKDTVLLSATASLLTNKNIHPDHVRLLSREAVNIHSKPGLLEKSQQFPSVDYLEVPIHADAERYLKSGPSFLEKFFPYSLATTLDRLKILLIPLLTLLFPLIKGVFPLYRWRIRKRNYLWYKEIYQADLQVYSNDLAVLDTEIEKMTKLHGELLREVSVPLAYMSEFYQLRTHTNLVLNQLEDRRDFLLNRKNARRLSEN